MVIPSAKPPTTGPRDRSEKGHHPVSMHHISLFKGTAHTRGQGAQRQPAQPWFGDSILPSAPAAEVGEQTEAVWPDSGLTQACKEH